MKPAPLIALAGALLAASVPAEATRMFRCVAQGGAVSYQELPCSPAASEQSVDVRDFPAVNQVERDRLLSREAALDARMLKRAEIDASERIAREARWAREAELEAERERTRAAEAQSYYPIFPVYGGRPPVRPRPVYRHGTQPYPVRY